MAIFSSVAKTISQGSNHYDKKMLVLVMLGIMVGCALSQNSSTRCRADVMFMFDASGSVGKSNFQKELDFAKEVINQFIIGPTTVQIAAGSYSSSVVLQFDLDDKHTKAEVTGATGIDGNTFLGRRTATGDALRLMQTILDPLNNRGARIGVPKIAIILTDGRRNAGELISGIANELDDMGVTVIAVGIGNSIQNSELEAITNGKKNNVIQTADFDRLPDEVNKVAQRFCVTDGMWSDWTPFGDCSATCDGGEKIRTRTCTMPEPQNGGAACPGPASDIGSCNTQQCRPKTVCAWSNWSSWGYCDAVCGGGGQLRTRTCNNPYQSECTCRGPEDESRTCNQHACPSVDCRNVVHDGNYAEGACLPKFITCSGGQATSRSCPTGTIFSPKNGICDYADNVRGCSTTTAGYPASVTSRYPVPVKSQYSAPVKSQYPALVMSQYPTPVMSQYPAPVMSQYPSPVMSPTPTPSVPTCPDTHPNTTVLSTLLQLFPSFRPLFPSLNSLFLMPQATSLNINQTIAVQLTLSDALMQAMGRRGGRIQSESMRASQDRGRPRRRRRPFERVQRFLSSNDFVKQLSLFARTNLNALEILKSSLGLNNAQISEVGRTIMPRGGGAAAPPPMMMMSDQRRPPPPRNACPYTNINCNSVGMYRSIDGSCNNLQNPRWGMSFTPLQRFLYPDYADGIGQPRLSKYGQVLPSPRAVSRSLFEDVEVSGHIQSLAIMTFGQFLDHDMDKTAIATLFTDDNGTTGSQDVMCGDTGCETDGMGLSNCLPIIIPSGDVDFMSQRCLEFVRSEAVPPLTCTLGPRQQLNQITSYLDSSNVYASSKEDSDALRDISATSRGRLLMTPHPFDSTRKNLLPRVLTAADTCSGINSTVRCFVGGDARANEQVSLTSLHTLFVREHNQIEAQLFALNPQWTGEMLFQETRRIVNAQWQHIIYNEYLPLILGPKHMLKYGLNLLPTGFYQGYSAGTNAGIKNVFATAAFRFGHSMIGDEILLSNSNHEDITEPELSSVFFNPSLLYQTAHGGVDAVLRGLGDAEGYDTDQFFSKQVTAHLFTPDPPNGIGTDLVSLNIQRGRDHGIAGYNDWRVFCGYPRATTIDGFADTIKNATLRAKLKLIYGDTPDDVDLFAAGVIEENVCGGSVGPTFACIIGKQFQLLRNGDRFWYENGMGTGTGHPFTPAQLAEIRKTSLARLMCNNADNYGTIQPRVLLLPRSQVNASVEFFQRGFSIDDLYSFGDNARVYCKTIAGLDLTQWNV